MTQYTLIVGEAATYEEDGVYYTDFQTINFIKTFECKRDAIDAGEDAITGNFDNSSYVIPEIYEGLITFNKKSTAL